MSKITAKLVEPEFNPVNLDQTSALSTIVSQKGGCRRRESEDLGAI